ncbi:MAG TPA: hypothetical protein VLX28_23850 [Thermoanaerobaculia bacterium]|nr:hypothetical protein [Thermoanaerobaculia bacterium]
MTRDEYEHRKQRLDEELREGMELLATAHRHQLRALELVWAATGGDGMTIPPPVLAPAGLNPGPRAVPAPAAAPPQPRRRGPWELLDDIEAALPKLPDVFDRNDICRALGYEPDRGSLYRTVQLLTQDGLLAVKQRGAGKTPTSYRKTGRSRGQAGE